MGDGRVRVCVCVRVCVRVRVDVRVRACARVSVFLRESGCIQARPMGLLDKVFPVRNVAERD